MYLCRFNTRLANSWLLDLCVCSNTILTCCFICLQSTKSIFQHNNTQSLVCQMTISSWKYFSHEFVCFEEISFFPAQTYIRHVYNEYIMWCRILTHPTLFIVGSPRLITRICTALIIHESFERNYIVLVNNSSRIVLVQYHLKDGSYVYLYYILLNQTVI